MTYLCHFRVKHSKSTNQEASCSQVTSNSAILGNVWVSLWNNSENNIRTIFTTRILPSQRLHPGRSSIFPCNCQSDSSLCRKLVDRNEATVHSQTKYSLNPFNFTLILRLTSTDTNQSEHFNFYTMSCCINVYKSTLNSRFHFLRTQAQIVLKIDRTKVIVCSL